MGTDAQHGTVRSETREGGVRVVVLDEPDRRNALSVSMADELRALWARLADDDDARAVVVTGAGSSFCAGADLPGLFGDAADRSTEQVRDRLAGYYRAFLDLRALPVPTIAAVNGPAIGAGLNLALSCDVRLAGTEASFGATFSRIGLHPGGGCTWFLQRALGHARALTVLLRGEPLAADRACAMGLADGPVEDPLAAALGLAEDFAGVEPSLARTIVATTRLAGDGAGFDEVLAVETWAQAVSARSPQVADWVARFARGTP